MGRGRLGWRGRSAHGGRGRQSVGAGLGRAEEEEEHYGGRRGGQVDVG